VLRGTFARPGQTNEGHKLQIEPDLAKVMGQRSMVIAGCLEPDPHGPLVGGKSGSQTAGILQRVRDRQPATALLARDANQDVVPVFGNVDSDQQGRSGRLDGGHSRSPQWCGLRKTTVET